MEEKIETNEGEVKTAEEVQAVIDEGEIGHESVEDETENELEIEDEEDNDDDEE